MADLFKDIIDFHRKFGLTGSSGPSQLQSTLAMFRVGFMMEELTEYTVATTLGDKEKQFDALIDLTYVALGTAHMHGFPFNEGWELVHAANMRKVRVDKALNSKRGSEFDVIKPEGWTPPDLKHLVRS